MFFISNPSLSKFETFMQEVPHFPPKGMKVDLDKLEDEILLFEVEKIIVSLKQISFQLIGEVSFTERIER